MKDPVKRAVTALVIAAIVLLGGFVIPGVKDNKLGDFLKGGSVGIASVAALMLVIAIFQRPKASRS